VPQFLADESCDFAVVRTLRAAGHDVLAISERARGAADQVVIAMAVAEQRILITEDTDFGQLVYAHAHASSGVVLIRFPACARRELATQVLQLVDQAGDRLTGAFVVVQPGRTRVGRSP
jgi:predicted nuclease of predicted toxin-antitoxin system